MLAQNKIYFLLLAAVLLYASPASADDVGITKARLIQKNDSSYVFEVDVTRQLVWAIKAPIFPDRFQVTELEFITQAGWIVVQATATTSGEPLSPDDEILLPWFRNGADITAQWLDGSLYQGLFLRSLEGIHVPISLLMPTTKTPSEVCVEHFTIGLEHFLFKGVHLLFVLVLALFAASRNLFKILLYYFFGQAISLILYELGVSGFDLLFVDVMGVVLIFMLAYAVLKEKPIQQYYFLIFLFGALHGLAYSSELSSFELELDQRLPALFMFNIAIDLCNYILGSLLFFVIKVFIKNPKTKNVLAYGSGILSVVLLIILFQENIFAGKTDVLNIRDTKLATQFSLPTSPTQQPGGQQQTGARKLTSSIMAYLTVEPYEVRMEILIQAREAVRFLGVNDKGMGSIPVASLEPVKNGILGTYQKINSISIDGNQADPILTRADFVTLGPAGVILRTDPVAESLDNGIIGLTLVYETNDLANNISVDWKLFSESVQKVEATTIDPFGGATRMLSPDDNTLHWKQRLIGYKVPVIEEITVEQQQLPIISIILFAMVLILFLISKRNALKLIGRPVLLSVAGIAFILYPFSRISVELPFSIAPKPSEERTAIILEGLLTNVYRSFDIRNESDIYDRLSISVIGDQLSQIYLESRRLLELENRGGARARIDEVEIIDINSVEATNDGGLEIDGIWKVSGSVNHYGHTHYRQNINQASINIIADEGAWKILQMNMIDEKRVL
ncbi:MAG: HupE/UreJ family protein [Ignavibacterium sp.]|nr:MAG: HupE/UreJ family protein [Ignavibacterium sp.]